MGKLINMTPSQTRSNRVSAEVRTLMARQGKYVVGFAIAIGRNRKTANSRYTGLTDMSLEEIFLCAQWLDVEVGDLLAGFIESNRGEDAA
jgi:hypothetical protein